MLPSHSPLPFLRSPALPPDYFFDKVNGESNGGNRYATVLMYLNDVEEGGETVFPNIPAPGGDNGPAYSECARHNLAAKPSKGSAVLFHSIKPSGELERRSLHTAWWVAGGGVGRERPSWNECLMDCRSECVQCWADVGMALPGCGCASDSRVPQAWLSYLPGKA
jgi:hypothetical protein